MSYCNICWNSPQTYFNSENKFIKLDVNCLKDKYCSSDINYSTMIVDGNTAYFQSKSYDILWYGVPYVEESCKSSIRIEELQREELPARSSRIPSGYF